MPIPTAHVKVEFLKILHIPAASLPAGVTRYARATFQAGFKTQVSTGRSRPIPHSAGDFDVTVEASPWIFETNVNAEDSITISVEIWEDHGDAEPFLASTSATLISDPWTSGERTFSDRCTVRVTTTLISPVDKAHLARAAKASGISGSLTVAQGFFVEFVDIQGLYKPRPGAVPPLPGSVHETGYCSEDNLGRIFTNRKPDGKWKGGAQFIDVFVKVTAFGGPVFPGGAKIDWTVLDVDDPTNDASDFRREWGPYVDASDYDASRKPIGAHPDDNTLAYSSKNLNEDLLFGSGPPTARWEQAPGGPAVAASSRTRATTGLKSTGPKTGTSSVRIHCPNVLGTNLVLKAELIGTPAGIPVHNAQSGTMTMWCRLDVEVTRMAGAHSLSGALPAIPPFFHPACVQLDFQKENSVGDNLDREELAKADKLLEDAAQQWVSDAKVFKNVGQPGWFFLGAARLPYPLAVSETGDITAGSKKITGLSAPGTPALSENTSVSGDGIPVGAKIVSIDNATSVTLSAAATKTKTGTSLSFGPIIITETGNTVTASKKITGLSGSGSSGLKVGMSVYGDGIPDDTIIKSIDSHTSITLSDPATQTREGTTLRFEPALLLSKGTNYKLSQSDASVWLEVPRSIVDPEVAWFAWDHGHGRQNAIFEVATSFFMHGSTFMLMGGSDITPAFTGHDADGSEEHAYKTLIEFAPGYQRAGKERVLHPGGIAIPSGATLKILRAGAGYTSGVSPSVPLAGGTGKFFAGRTIVFTYAPEFSAGSPPAPNADFDQQVLGTIVHEFVHAFGMPHKCGNWDWRTPKKQSCCMNYNVSWLVDEDALHRFNWPDLAKQLRLKPGTLAKTGKHMCARHLMEVRRVHLEKNLGLNWNREVL